MRLKFLIIILSTGILIGCINTKIVGQPKSSGNPIFQGWYADPEGIVYNGEYWIFPTYSASYENQVFLDAFSSKDLVNWKKHVSILDTSKVKWAKEAMWAPSSIQKDNKYYLFFSANDIQSPEGPWWNPEKDIENEIGGIGIGIADKPEGPYKDYLGKPLINNIYNKAQPIDQFVFKDVDGTFYIFYGGWGHCNLGVLNEKFTGFVPWEDGTMFKEMTPKGYIEGPFVFLRNDKYYFMWSEGSWTDDSYKVAYATADKITGPYERIGTILELDKDVATGAGHNSVINVPGIDKWYMIYHRRPIPNEGRDHRVTCIDKLEFDDNGLIKEVKMTFEGVMGFRITPE